MKKLLLILLCVPLIGIGLCISGDCNNGYGTYIWNNGDKYIGYSMNNMCHGQGIATFVDGTVKDGLWENGVFIGN
jgi:hypothetical protein